MNNAQYKQLPCSASRASFAMLTAGVAIAALASCSGSHNSQNSTASNSSSDRSSAPSHSSASDSGLSSSSANAVSSMSLTSSSTASSSAAANACIEDPLASGYCLVWRDEFSTNSVDLAKWSYEKNCYGGGNGEAQCYVEHTDNVWVDGDILHIKAIREDAVGPNTTEDDPNYDPSDTSGTGTYTSGRLRSIMKGDWQYGRFEIRAKLPYGQGTWPAIWMLPTDWVYGGWASSGEIDIMEAVNLKVGGENRIHGTLHFGDNWPNNVYSGTEYILPSEGDPADAFHTYAVEWEQGEIRWFVDGDHYATQTSAGWYSAAALDDAHAPFNQRFHLLLNLAVGGNWAGQVNDTGIDEAVFPQAMQVDYVRVYQCTKDLTTGKGCASRDDDFDANPGITPPQPVDTSGETLVLFNGTTTPPYVWGVYSDEGSVDYRVIDAGGDYGTVGEITYATNSGVGFYQTSTGTDLSAYDFIEFDLRITADSRVVKDPLVFRADCIWPCTSGDYAIGYPTLNTWNHYKIALSELATAGLNLTQINAPFVISPQAPNQAGVVLQVDNVALTK